MINHETAAPQFFRDPRRPIAAPVFQEDLLNSGPQRHLLLLWFLFLPVTIKSSPAHLGQLTHPFNTQPALQAHHFPDLVVDAVSPCALLCFRRAATFCKAPLKKSISRVFSANSRFSSLISVSCFSA